MFVVDVLKENIAVREANRLGIPVFAIVDTNSDPSQRFHRRHPVRKYLLRRRPGGHRAYDRFAHIKIYKKRAVSLLKNTKSF